MRRGDAGWEQEATGLCPCSLLSREHIPFAWLLGIFWRVESQFRESTLNWPLAGVSTEGSVLAGDPDFPLPLGSSRHREVATGHHLIPGFRGIHFLSAWLLHDISVSQFWEWHSLLPWPHVTRRRRRAICCRQDSALKVEANQQGNHEILAAKITFSQSRSPVTRASNFGPCSKIVPWLYF